jgi:hypothetical protein
MHFNASSLNHEGYQGQRYTHIIYILDMPHGFSRRLIRHGLLFCTSALGTGYFGQYILEVN